MACYLCGSEQSTRRKGQVRDDPGAQVHQCDACGLVYLTSCEHKDADFYGNGGMHGNTGNAIPVERWLREAARDDRRRFEYFREQLINKSVLDFGCGAGGFLLRAQEIAGSVAGVELEERLMSHFKKHAINVCADIDHFPKGEKFDIITAFHVIEHLPDPRNMLEKFKAYLASEGKIIIEVPSADDALLTLYENEPFSRFTYWSCHRFLFNAHTLPLLAKQAGLHVTYVKHVQRYPLSNHLYWLARGKPGGHEHWAFLDNPEMTAAYESTLAQIGKTDTLIACLTH